MDTVHHAAEKPQQNSFAAAEDAHGASHPESHQWTRNKSERYAIAFSHFEMREKRDGKAVETLVGQLEDGTRSREWLFEPESDRGWRARQHEFIAEVRPELEPGDILVMDLGAERPSAKNPDNTVRDFSGSHYPVRKAPDFPLSDEDADTQAALEEERDKRDAAVGQLHAPTGGE